MLHITSSCGSLSKWDVIYSSLHNASLRHYGKALVSENRPEKCITQRGETQSISHSLIFLCFFIAFFSLFVLLMTLSAKVSSSICPALSGAMAEMEQCTSKCLHYQYKPRRPDVQETTVTECVFAF